MTCCNFTVFIVFHGGRERREKHARRERPAAKHKSPTLTLSDLFPLFRAIAKFLGAAGADKVAPLVTEHVNIMIYDFCYA